MAFERSGGEGGGEREGEGEGDTTILEPGTFVELRRTTTSTNAIILSSSYTSRALTYYSLTSKGEIWTHLKDDVYFDVPGFVRDQGGLIRRCGGGEGEEVLQIAETKSQLEARVEVLKKLKEVEREVESAMNVVMSRQAIDIYRLLSERIKWAETTVGEVAKILGPTNRKHTEPRILPTHSPIKTPTFYQTLAAHKYLLANSLYFVPAHDYSTSRKVRVRPREDVEMIQAVDGWVREGEGNPLEGFIDKVRSMGSTLLTWTPTDQSIIKFLIKALKPSYQAQGDPYLLGVQYIIKKVYRDVDDVTDEVLHRLLVGIGAFAPWQDLTEIRAIAEGELYLGKPGGTVLGPEDFYPTDPAREIRYDFGDMPVYVIDDVGAKELDDGISVEPTLDTNEIWIHIHIADPTSLLPPTHGLAKEAEKMTESMYLVHRFFPMLPTSFTHHPQHGFSLGCTGTSQPTLTFSVKLSLDTAQIVEYKVRAGVVKNLVVLSYDQVDSLLGFDKPKWESPFGAGGEESVSSSADAESDQQNLALLYKASQALVRKRFDDGVFIQSRPITRLGGIDWPLSPSPILGFPITTTDTPVSKYPYTDHPFFRVAPGKKPLTQQYLTQYYTSSQHTLDAHSRSLVAECMKLASRACSMFCRDRDVPVLRRWAGAPMVSGESGLAELLDARNEGGYLIWDEHGSNNSGWHLAGKHILGDSSAGYSLDVRGHWGLGVPEHEGYVRCTSPLRRYIDLLVHWQVKSALINEGAKTNPTISTASSTHIFSSTYLSSFATKHKASERFRKRIAGQHEAWWAICWLMRFVEVCKRMGMEMGGLGEWYEFTESSMMMISSPSSSPSSLSTLPSFFPSSSPSSLSLPTPNPFTTLTATLSGPPEPNRDSKKWQAAVHLTALGIKAVLVEGRGKGKSGECFLFLFLF
ncbi:hypothetical protein GGU11DRAFT_675550 [Lentinula aff. detonsa]|nr:hypothetical protein GGU11DRAFT_675550 [Lentinula aff. detonsa]